MYTKKAVVVMVLACLFFSGVLFSCPNVILVKVDKEIMCVKSENQAIAAEYDWGDVNKDPKWRWILYYDSKEITRSKEYNGKEIKAFKIKPEYLVDSKGNYRTGEYEVMLEIYGIHVDENGKEREYGWHETIGEKKTFGSCNFWAVEVDIDGLIYGEEGRKIRDIHKIHAKVIASGYIKFVAKIKPVNTINLLYYRWTKTEKSGEFSGDTEGYGEKYTEVKWDAPSEKKNDIKITLSVLESPGGPLICKVPIDLTTIRPYVVRLKFVDDFWNEEQHIHYDESDLYFDPYVPVDEDDPEYDQIVERSYAVCYVMKRGMQVEVDLAGDHKNDGINNLTMKTRIKIKAVAEYAQNKNEFTEDEIDENTKYWHLKDYEVVEIESYDNIPKITTVRLKNKL